jgi:hypothetical protein
MPAKQRLLVQLLRVLRQKRRYQIDVRADWFVAGRIEQRIGHVEAMLADLRDRERGNDAD